MPEAHLTESHKLSCYVHTSVAGNEERCLSQFLLLLLLLLLLDLWRRHSGNHRTSRLYKKRMVSSFSLPNKYCYGFPKEIKTRGKLDLRLLKTDTQVQKKRQLIAASHGSLLSRRVVSLVSISTVSFGLNAATDKTHEEGDGGVFGAMKSIFDPNEKTKSGKILPKGYLKAARELVRTLRESLEEDTKDVAKFRRNADAAKVSIREYLIGWRDQQTVVAEESYAALERAIRSLANFYAKAGPFASLSDEVKSSILNDLNTAEAFL